MIGVVKTPGFVPSHQARDGARGIAAPADSLGGITEPRDPWRSVRPGPARFEIQAVHWLDSEKLQAPTIVDTGRRFMADLRSTAERLDRQQAGGSLSLSARIVCEYTCDNKWVYWVTGIILPLLILFSVGRVFMAEADTVIQYLAKGINEDKKRKKEVDNLKTRLENKQGALKSKANRRGERKRKHLESRGTPKESPIVGGNRHALKRWMTSLDSWRNDRLEKRRSDVDERLTSVEKKVKSVEDRIKEQMRCKNDYEKVDHRKAADRLKNLGADLFGHMRSSVADPEARRAAVVGGVVCSVAFAVAMGIESVQLPPIGEWPSRGTKTVFVISAIFCAGTLLYRKQLDGLARISHTHKKAPASGGC